MDFTSHLSRFLWRAASEPNPDINVEQFNDSQARLTIQVLHSTEFTVTLRVEVVANETQGNDDIDGVEFEATRAALVTAAQEVKELGYPRHNREAVSTPEPLLPLDLFSSLDERRLPGIYRTGKGISGTDSVIAVLHYVTLGDWPVEDLVLSGIAELTNAPLNQIAIGLSDPPGTLKLLEKTV